MDIVRIVFRRTFVLFAVAMTLAATGYALASANTVTRSGAGDGQGPIVSYTLDPTSVQVSLDTGSDPTAILKLRFSIATGTGGAAPQTVKAGVLTSAGTLIGGWYGTCTNTSGTTWECLPSGAVAHAQTGMQLRVIATQ